MIVIILEVIIWLGSENNENNDFLLFGAWGRALYTMQAK
jgi:hypothetical protein